MTRLLSAAAKTVDARSTRSRQRKVGASEIGTCRRRAGYSHHGVKPSDPDNVASFPAVVGTWFHDGALDTMAREWGTLIETTVEDEILRGHVDAIQLPDDWREKAGLPPAPDAPDVVEVEDLKTKRDSWMVDYVRNHGPKRSELYQAMLYASLLRAGKIGRLNGKALKAHERALLLVASDGLPVETIRLRYIARTGEDSEAAEYVHEQPYDEEIADEAWTWVGQVATSESPDDLPRDQDGPGLSVVCDNCPWLTACWGEPTDVAPQAQLIVTNADLAATLHDYHNARAEEHEAKARKDLARAKLDGTEPAIYTDGEVAYKLRWSGGRMGEPKMDIGRMVHLFEQAGLDVPMLEAKPTAKSIGITVWEAPDPVCGKPVGDPEEHPHHDGDRWWVQNRPRGGWTGYEDQELAAEETAETLTAGQFAKRFPDYVDPRPTCVLKKAHSGDCADAEVFVDLGEAARADLRAVPD